MRSAFFLLLLLTVGLSWSCQRDHQPISLALNEGIYNSYHKAFNGADNLLLNDKETVIYDKGRWKVGTRSVDVRLDDIRFRLSLIDANQNGLFNEVGEDLVVVSVYGQDTVALDLRRKHIGRLREQSFVKIDRWCFLLSGISEDGFELQLTPWERCPSEAVAARFHTRVGTLPVRGLDGKKVHLPLRSEADKQQLLVVWNYSDEGTALIDWLLAAKQAWAPSYELIGLNMKDDLQEIQDFIEQHELGFETFLVTRESCAFIDCHALPPYGILISKDGRLLRTGIKSDEIKRLIQREMGEVAM